MKKAAMYLLLAVGISITVLLVGGALLGFVAGFIDGYYENHPGTTQAESVMFPVGLFSLALLCVVMHWVFLHYGFASYSEGRIPKASRWKVYVPLLLTMGGLALVYVTVYNPLAASAPAKADDLIRENYLWMKDNPLQALLFLMLGEATADLVIFGAVMRELLEWKHRPQVIVPVIAAVLAVFAGVSNSFDVALVTMVVGLVEGWTYEYTRSVIPVVVGDAFFWAVTLCLIGPAALPSWCFLVAFIIILAAGFWLIKSMDSFKPID